MKKSILILFTLAFLPFNVYSHAGKTNADGCHFQADEYHCHGNKNYTKPYQSKYKKSKNENYQNKLFCDELGGKTEVKHYYNYGTKKSFIKVDCETKDYVYEGGKDKRSSLDSIQQVIFFSLLVGKKPAVVIYDTDGKVGKYEHRIKQVAESLGIMYIRQKERK